MNEIASLLEKEIWKRSPLEWALDHGLWKLPVRPKSFHYEWLECAASHFWHSRQSTVAEHLILRAPKDFAKSTCFAFIFPTWVICHDPEIRIILASETMTQSERRVYAIRTELEINEKLKARYGEFKGRGKWSSIEFTIAQRRNQSMVDGTLRAAATEAAIEGGRCDLVIGDDLVSPENQATPDRRGKVLRWFSHNLRGCCEPNAMILLDGTRKNHADLYSVYALKPHWAAPEDWLEADYIGSDGLMHSKWPELWPSETLRALREESPSAYDRDKRNRPMSEEDSPFPEAWLEYAKNRGSSFNLGPARAHPLAGSFKIISQAWDVAGVTDPVKARKNDSDYYACATVGMQDDGTIVLCDLWRERGISWTAWLNQIRAQYALHQPDCLIVESNAVQEVLRQIAGGLTGLPVKRHVRGGAENALLKTRDAALSIRFETRQFVLPYGSEYTRKMVDDLCEELNQYGVAKHDDLLKALDMAVQHTTRNQTGPTEAPQTSDPRMIESMGDDGYIFEGGTNARIFADLGPGIGYKHV